MSRWFRLYADALRNPKVAALSDREFRLWVKLLAVAAENDGSIPDLEALKHVLNGRLDHLLTGVERLIIAGLIDCKEVGYEPHNWTKFQYKSDTSTDRVKKHRQERNVSETAPEQNRTEAERDMKNISLQDERDFEVWYAAYPRHVGKGAARKAYRAARKKADAETLLAGAGKASVEFAGRQSQFIPHPASWLNGERWADVEAANSNTTEDLSRYADKNGNLPGDPYYGVDY